MKPLTPATTLHAKPSINFAEKLAATQAHLKAAASELQPLKQASSLGAEDVVITHIINSLSLDIPVFVLETGALHSETLALLERLQAHSRAPVQVYKPQQDAVIAFVKHPGQQAIFESIANRKACCGVRKLEPLGRALQGQQAWVTGLRREQSQARAEVSAQEAEVANGVPILKLNPLVDWTWGDVWHYIATHQVDYNPLHDQFFPSIGCAPCTRAISLGEDFRAGRWWWEDESAKECGLHVKA
ncbi:MAG: phosphoadenylyl-sulfate reductase [Betaproteobacteria bacterium]|nr:phosphoadenylyl-sulfate reductase [Betaproteobacteria bacterium]NBY04236.1 phosphoadenylyl-sulfate reductase [Betaproteobacteria bacterium]